MRIVIVGGGLWGLSIALHLALLGEKEVTLLERRDELASETTSQAAGQVGQIRSSRALTDAVGETLTYLEHLHRRGVDVGFKQTGSLLLALRPDRWDSLHSQRDKIVAHGLKADILPAEVIPKFCPTINSGKVLGGLYIPRDGYVDSRKLALRLAEEAIDSGVSIETGVAMLSIVSERGEMVGVETTNGQKRCDVLVIAAGPWSRNLATPSMPGTTVLALQHQRAKTAPIADLRADHPVVRLPDLSCYVRPEDGGLTFGYFDPTPVEMTADPTFRTKQLVPRKELLDTALNNLSPIVPVLARERIVGYRTGLVTFSPDGKFMVGSSREVKGLYFASACAAMGVAGFIPVGRQLANQIVGQPNDSSMLLWSPDRFAHQSSTNLAEAAKASYANYYAIKPMLES